MLLVERAQGTVAALALGLPRGVLRLLAGGTLVRIDGQELDPEVQFILALLRVFGHRDLSIMTPAQAREEIRRDARVFAGATIPMAGVESLTLPGPAQAIPAVLYVPRVVAPSRPLVVY